MIWVAWACGIVSIFGLKPTAWSWAWSCCGRVPGSEAVMVTGVPVPYLDLARSWRALAAS
jgi:hypothetical protein